MIKMETLKESKDKGACELINEFYDEKILDEAKKYVDDLFSKSSSELYEEMLEEVLCYDEEECIIDFDIYDTELTNALFDVKYNWEDLKEDACKDVLENVIQVLSEKLGLEKVPTCNFYLTEEKGNYGFYSKEDNSINVNLNYIQDYKENIKTIAHEVRHAYQHQRAEIGETYYDDLCKCNIDNYQSLAYVDGYCVNFFEYYNQFVEVDARAFEKLFSNWENML